MRDNRVITKCTKGEGKPAVATRMSGADLSAAATGKAHLKASLPAVLGENPPYGMIGGIEETSASFEARSAPRSYPTENDPVANTSVSTFTQALADLGWTDGRNLRMDLRWFGDDINRSRALAQE